MYISTPIIARHLARTSAITACRAPQSTKGSYTAHLLSSELPKFVGWGLHRLAAACELPHHRKACTHRFHVANPRCCPTVVSRALHGAHPFARVEPTPPLGTQSPSLCNDPLLKTAPGTATGLYVYQQCCGVLRHVTPVRQHAVLSRATPNTEAAETIPSAKPRVETNTTRHLQYKPNRSGAISQPQEGNFG